MRGLPGGDAIPRRHGPERSDEVLERGLGVVRRHAAAADVDVVGVGDSHGSSLSYAGWGTTVRLQTTLTVNGSVRNRRGFWMSPRDRGTTPAPPSSIADWSEASLR